MRDAMSAATIPTTGMASTSVIRTKLSGITYGSTESDSGPGPGRWRQALGHTVDAAFYPVASERGKNGSRAAEVSGFGTPPATCERSRSNI